MGFVEKLYMSVMLPIMLVVFITILSYYIAIENQIAKVGILYIVAQFDGFVLVWRENVW